jgi:peptidoglycan/xylan/chitin deacetylase (PgdA/CDA1 family)
MKKHLFALLYWMGITRLSAWWNRKNLVILSYHGLLEDGEISLDDPLHLHVHRDRFIAQLKYLKRHHHIISLSHYLAARREGRPIPDYAAVLTFEDGYRSFLSIAAPILVEHGVPATAFIISDIAGATDLLEVKSKYGSTPYLSWSDIRALESHPKLEFGSHTCSHPSLTEIGPEEVRTELIDSLHAVRSNIKHSLSALAYPNGAYSTSISQVARSVGYSCALTIDSGSNDINADLFSLRRQMIFGYDDLRTFAGRVSCLNHVLIKIRDTAKRVMPSTLFSFKKSSSRRRPPLPTGIAPRKPTANVES